MGCTERHPVQVVNFAEAVPALRLVTGIILYRPTRSIRRRWPVRPDVAVLHPLILSMPFQHRSGWPRRIAVLVILHGALPLSLLAQVRRPDPVPAGPRASTSAPKRRIELFVGAGTVAFNQANATKSSLPIGIVGFRHQLSPEWLSVGGSIEFGSTSVNGKFFPFEKRPVGDSTQFVQVDGHATMIAPRLSADVLFPLDEEEKFRAGASANVGAYAMMPSPKGGSGAGTFVAPTFGAAFIGEADLTPRIGVTASLGFAQFLNFDREKLRPSDPALEDPVFTTPFATPPAAVKSFGGARLLVGITYRLGVTTTQKRTK